MAGTERRLKDLKRAAHEKLIKDPEASFRHITDILNIDMDDPQGIYMAGCYFRKRGHSGAAANFFRRAVALQPDKINTWLHFGATLHDLHQYDAAMQAFQAAKAINHEEPSVYANMAASMVQTGNFAEALSYALEALKRAPDHNTALTCRGMAYLGLERWREGFRDYKHIYGGQIVRRVYCIPEEPEWNGEKGKTVVVQCDQGIGDEIRYASLLHDLSKDCKVVLDCHPKLENLFKRSFPDISVHGSRKHRGLEWPRQYNIEAHTHVSGLGRFYRSKDKDFPRKPYLVVDEGLKTKWRHILKDLPRPLVGIAWQGGLINTGREWRSTELTQWKPLVDLGGTFIDLSYHDSQIEVEQSELPIFRPQVNQDEYDDTLALLSELDLAVCVPTTVMHAMGAIGKPVWVLVPHWTPWEFGKRRDDMIWYPKDTIRLFRADKPEFDDTIQKIAEAYAASYDRGRSPTAASLHRRAELDSAEGEQAGQHYGISLISTADHAKRAHGIHF